MKLRSPFTNDAAQPRATLDMKRTILSFTIAALLAAQNDARAVLGVGDIVSDPIAEEALIHKNIFDKLKYAWEQAQWADKLATLHDTLITVRQHLETANIVKQAIGDPVAAIALIDNGLFSDFLQDSGITDTLTDLAGIAQEGVQLSATIQELFEPIDMSSWSNVSGDTLASFEGIASFRESSDPLKRFRAVENAYSRLEILIGRAQNKRRTLNLQIARLNGQLKNARDDAEVQNWWVHSRQRKPRWTTSTTFLIRLTGKSKCCTCSIKTVRPRRKLLLRK
jgi:hypothetical protein